MRGRRKNRFNHGEQSRQHVAADGLKSALCGRTLVRTDINCLFTLTVVLYNMKEHLHILSRTVAVRISVEFSHAWEHEYRFVATACPRADEMPDTTYLIVCTAVF